MAVTCRVVGEQHLLVLAQRGDFQLVTTELDASSDSLNACFVNAFCVQASVVAPLSEDASLSVPCFCAMGTGCSSLRWWTLGWPRCASRCVCAPLRPCVSLPPAGVRASLFSGSGPQEGICCGGRERDHVTAGKEPTRQPWDEGASRLVAEAQRPLPEPKRSSREFLHQAGKHRDVRRGSESRVVKCSP